MTSLLFIFPKYRQGQLTEAFLWKAAQDTIWRMFVSGWSYGLLSKLNMLLSCCLSSGLSFCLSELFLLSFFPSFVLSFFPLSFLPSCFSLLLSPLQLFFSFCSSFFFSVGGMA